MTCRNPWVGWHQCFFSRNHKILLRQEIQIKIAFWYKISSSFNFFESLKIALTNMVTILMILAFLKAKIFWNKGYDVIIPVYDVIKKTLSRDSNYIIDTVMWSRFGNSSISMREVIITSILQKFNQKKQLFWGVILVQVQ